MTRQLHAPTAGGSTTVVAPSTCTHCGACYGSTVSPHGSFTCIKEFKNQGLGFSHGGVEHVCKHFYAGWACHPTPGYCDDPNSAGMYVGNYEGEDTCCAGTDTSYGKGCADSRAETEYDYDAQWGCCGEGGAPVVADAETTIYLGDPGAGGLNSCDVKVTLAWPGSGAAMPEPTAKPVAAPPTAKPTPQPGAPAPSGPPSAGSCYPTPTTVTCDVAEADCDANHYAPGFIGGSGCCHCDSLECDHGAEQRPFAECSTMYYPGMPEAGDEEPAPAPAPAPEEPAPAPTPEPAPAPAPGSGQTSAGSCYNFATHAVTCDVAEGACGGQWYAPGTVGSNGCCHCDSVECDHSKETSEEACSYYAMPEAGDGDGGGATCADNQKKGKCNKAPGCEWKGGECGDKATDGEGEGDGDAVKAPKCKKLKTEDECKANKKTCKWKKNKDKCKDKPPKCKKLKTKDECKANKKTCKWKGDKCKDK
jgi:hypothetical protein